MSYYIINCYYYNTFIAIILYDQSITADAPVLFDNNFMNYQSLIPALSTSKSHHPI